MVYRELNTETQYHRHWFKLLTQVSAG